MEWPKKIHCGPGHNATFEAEFSHPHPHKNETLLPFLQVVITCHYCGEAGHKVSHCQKMPPELKEQHLANTAMWQGGVADAKYSGYAQVGRSLNLKSKSSVGVFLIEK